ncbi:MAG: glycoside hydrolase family 97 protein [Prevotellaceae bacterium]|jgi:alpha-glucosidase|nr:glycoside hydrolase family 97 protein [Prevotellaceae bacterium]
MNTLIKRFCVLTFLLYSSVFAYAQQSSVELLSPDGKIRLAVTLGDKIAYTVYCDNQPVMQNNELQLTLRNETLGAKPRLTGQKRASVDNVIKPVVPFKFSTVVNRYNQLTLDFKDNYSVEFRAFDDGVAYRFITRKKGSIDVMHEDFNLYFPDDYLLELQCPGRRGFASVYEDPYSQVESQKWQVKDDMSVLPILIDTRKGVKILVTEADVRDYPHTFVKGAGKLNSVRSVYPRVPTETAYDERGMSLIVTKEADCIARTAGSREFPWRTFIIARRDGQLVESTMICRLSPQNVIEDVSWIKPGLVAWDWINRWADYGPEVKHKAGVNTAAYKHYIDFASRYRIPYLILDEGWSKNRAHPKEVVPDLDLPEVIRYGNEKNVGIILWITYAGINEDFDDDSFNLFEYFSKMGVKGFKIDFMDRSDQTITNFYERAAREAAKYKMLVELHGSYKPTGMEFRYPNVLSYEGVMGLENGLRATPDNSLYMPFMRNVTGPMSFTPGSMLNVQPENARNGLGSNLVTIGTRVHHIAYYILFESGLQMISDSPRQFDQNPDCAAFIFSTPVTWDETRALVAEAGQYVVVARRHGDKWWIGGIANNAETVREFDLPLDFLPQGKTLRMTAFEDGQNADRQAMDYNVRQQDVKHNDILHVQLARNGGFAAVIE